MSGLKSIPTKVLRGFVDHWKLVKAYHDEYIITTGGDSKIHTVTSTVPKTPELEDVIAKLYSMDLWVGAVLRDLVIASVPDDVTDGEYYLYKGRLGEFMETAYITLPYMDETSHDKFMNGCGDAVEPRGFTGDDQDCMAYARFRINNGQDHSLFTPGGKELTVETRGTQIRHNMALAAFIRHGLIELDTRND